MTHDTSAHVPSAHADAAQTASPQQPGPQADSGEGLDPSATGRSATDISMGMSMADIVDVDGVRGALNARIASHCASLRQQVSRISDDALALVDQIDLLLTGGKRFRAAFAYWAYQAVQTGLSRQPGQKAGKTTGKNPTAQGQGTSDHAKPNHNTPDHNTLGNSTSDHATPDHSASDHNTLGHNALGHNAQTADAVIRLATALELFQASCLFHDDVLDRADHRRGQPSAHIAFEARHRAQGWEGDAQHFGVSAAILLGDLTLIAAHREVASLPHSVRTHFADMASEVMVGQYLDVLAQASPWGCDPQADEAQARVVVTAKSASYSVRHPIVLGCLLAQAPPETLAALDAFGLCIGEAFQLRDDILGVFGDTRTTGKPSGDDLREGKRTVLMARTMAQASASQRATVISLLGKDNLTKGQVDTLKDIIVATGALAAVESLIDHLVHTAHSHISPLASQLSPQGYQMLITLAQAATQRQL